VTRRCRKPSGRSRASCATPRRSSATEVVDALETRGLVERRADPDDRRATLVEVTEHGASVFDAIRALRGTEAERAFGRLSEADRVHLARILRKLRD
jgi:DNA-binding MarR family transcriptional regulator